MITKVVSIEEIEIQGVDMSVVVNKDELIHLQIGVEIAKQYQENITMVQEKTDLQEIRLIDQEKIEEEDLEIVKIDLQETRLIDLQEIHLTDLHEIRLIDQEKTEDEDLEIVKIDLQEIHLIDLQEIRSIDHQETETLEDTETDLQEIDHHMKEEIKVQNLHGRDQNWIFNQEQNQLIQLLYLLNLNQQKIHLRKKKTNQKKT